MSTIKALKTLLPLVLLLSCSIDRSFRQNENYDIGRNSTRTIDSITGVCSYYGKKFHGKQTANGEFFDMYALTAAHKSLPFGTVLEVENLANNKKVVVRINDRGPFVRNRILDLSYAAAQAIDMLNSGTTKIKATIIKK